MHCFAREIWSYLLIFGVDTMDFSWSTWDPNLVMFLLTQRVAKSFKPAGLSQSPAENSQRAIMGGGGVTGANYGRERWGQRQ